MLPLSFVSNVQNSSSSVPFTTSHSVSRCSIERSQSLYVLLVEFVEFRDTFKEMVLWIIGGGKTVDKTNGVRAGFILYEQSSQIVLSALMLDFMKLCEENPMVCDCKGV